KYKSESVTPVYDTAPALYTCLISLISYACQPSKPPPQRRSPKIPAGPPGQIPSDGPPPPPARPSIRAAPRAPSPDHGNPLLRFPDSPAFPVYPADDTFQPAMYSSSYNHHNNILRKDTAKALSSPRFSSRAH